MEHAVPQLRFKGGGLPVAFRPRWHHVGMAGQHQQGLSLAVHRPQIADFTKGQVTTVKAGFFQTAGDQLLTTSVFGSDGGAPDQFAGQLQHCLLSYAHAGPC